MYCPGQIVFGLESLVPVQIGDDVWNEASYPEKTTNFACGNSRSDADSEYGVRGSGRAGASLCPHSLDKAKEALLRGVCYVDIHLASAKRDGLDTDALAAKIIAIYGVGSVRITN